MDDAVRKAKEAFVTGHIGGDIHDISLLVISMGLSTITSQLLLAYKLPKMVYHLADIITMFFFPLLTCLYTEFTFCVILAQLMILLIIYINYPFFSFSCPVLTSTEQSIEDQKNAIYDITLRNIPMYVELASSPTYSWVKHVLLFRIPSISRLRTSLFILTSICILAVDFHIFPRSNAKTEEYGTGLMDIGVGGFLFCNALVHPLTKTGLIPRSLEKTSFYSTVVKPIKGVLPLAVIGLLRLVVLSFINYQSHVTEYGVHWNFFFTLAAVMVLCSLFHYFITILTSITSKHTQNDTTDDENLPATPQNKPMVYIYSSIFIIFCFSLGFALLYYYNYLLSSPYPFPILLDPTLSTSIITTADSAQNTIFTYRNWLFGPDRNGFIAQNKEGLFSLYGYFALAIISIGFGRLLNIIQYFYISLYPTPTSPTPTSPLTSKFALKSTSTSTSTSQICPIDNLTEDNFIFQTRGQVALSRIHAIVTGFLTILFWFLTTYTRNNFDNVSRRLCNISFCFWILHIACLLLTLCAIPDALFYLRVNPNKARYSKGNTDTILSANTKTTNGQSGQNSQSIPTNLLSKHTDPWNYHTDKILSANTKKTPHAHDNQQQNQNQNQNQKQKQITINPINVFDPVLPSQQRVVRPKRRETVAVNIALYEKHSNRLSLRPTNDLNTTTTFQTAPHQCQSSYIDAAFPPNIIEGVNSNALKYFLFTNFFTGLTNFLIVTMDASNTIAFIVLCLYLVVSYTIACLPIGKTIACVQQMISGKSERNKTHNDKADTRTINKID